MIRGRFPRGRLSRNYRFCTGILHKYHMRFTCLHRAVLYYSILYINSRIIDLYIRPDTSGINIAIHHYFELGYFDFRLNTFCIVIIHHFVNHIVKHFVNIFVHHSIQNLAHHLHNYNILPIIFTSFSTIHVIFIAFCTIFVQHIEQHFSFHDKPLMHHLIFLCV